VGLLRRTIVVHTRLAGHMARVQAARARESGVQILTMGQLAARLAGGLLRPIDPDDLKIAVREALAGVQLGEPEPIKDLPGMVRAAAGTLDKLWSAAIDLSRQTHPRLAALHKLEQEVLRRLPACMKRPQDLVELARARIRFAKAVIGRVEIHGHSEMSPCWRPLLQALRGVVPVTWIAGSRHIPEWLGASDASGPRGHGAHAIRAGGEGTSGAPPDRGRGQALRILRSAGIEIRTEPPSNVEPVLYSCAHPHHEVVEAFRWMRGLLAAGTARPEEIAIAAASPADFDDHVLALSCDCNIPVHFVHGVKAVGGREGQLAAALAEVLVKGLSQERVRRLFAMLPRHAPALRDLPPTWTRVLPADAPLTSLDRWQQVFARTAADDWPEGIDHSATVLDILRRVAQGPAIAVEAGDTLLSGVARALWRRALQDGPAEALPVTLTRLRSDDGLEPATHVIFASAMALASAPRPYVRLLALNTGRWPRGISEDRLIPDHVMPIDELDPLPIAEADRRDFATIIAAAKSVTASFSRRDVEGRLLGRSPLVTSVAHKCPSPQPSPREGTGRGSRPSPPLPPSSLQENEVYLGRARIPEHAGSESDRLLARPAEFASLPAGTSALACWRDWQRPGITAHDGFVGTAHSRLHKVFENAMSATSLRMLLRDPIRFVWRYALGWKQPDEADEPLTLDALALGTLVHDVLRSAVERLEDAGRFAAADAAAIEGAIGQALGEVTTTWELEQPVPPAVIWRSTLARIRELSLTALHCPLAALPGQKSWTEIPFGTRRQDGTRSNLPWDVVTTVEIPGTGMTIQGHIDRLDLAGDGTRARVIDYKTGRLRNNMAQVVLDGGKELQRCLYAFAVRTLIGPRVKVEASLLYPRAQQGEQALFPLPDVDAALAQLATALAIARKNMFNGIVAPGADAGDMFNDFAFALPASPSYVDRKSEPARERLGKAVEIWDAP
jgi:hypothetical protein